MSTQAATPDHTILVPLPNQLSLVPRPAPKFDAAFLDRRMRQHREWQQRELLSLQIAVTREVLWLDEIGEK